MQNNEFPTNPIQWHEGMLLLPQHFQQTDLRMDRLMLQHLQNMTPFFWGVNKLQIDQALLTTGVFRLLDLEAVMPDGLVVNELPVGAPPLQLELKPHAAEMQQGPVTIYLSVPEQHGNDADVIGALPRFSSFNSKGVSDINTGEEEVEIPRLRPNLALFAGSEPPAKYCSMPIAKVVFDSKSYSLSPYIPPFLNTTPTSALGMMCDEQAQKFRTKLGYLQQKVQGASLSSGAGDLPQEIENVRLKLVAGLLPFEAIYTSGVAHPFEIYKSICSLAGLISGIRFGEIPPHFEKYDHNNILGSIQQVLDYTNTVMDEIQESYSVAPFSPDGSAFKLRLKPEWLGTKIVLSAKLQSGMSRDQLADWIRNCVIVSESQVSKARDNRVLGPDRVLVDEVPEMNLVPVRGVQLFTIENDPQYIVPGEILCVFNDSDTPATRPAEILIYNAISKS